MTLLHMNVDACRSTKISLDSAKQDMLSQIMNIQTAINGMVNSAWIAPGANTFASDFEIWNSYTTQLLNHAETMSQNLSLEIDQWVDMANTY